MVLKSSSNLVNVHLVTFTFLNVWSAPFGISISGENVHTSSKWTGYEQLNYFSQGYLFQSLKDGPILLTAKLIKNSSTKINQTLIVSQGPSKTVYVCHTFVTCLYFCPRLHNGLEDSLPFILYLMMLNHLLSFSCIFLKNVSNI